MLHHPDLWLSISQLASTDSSDFYRQWQSQVVHPMDSCLREVSTRNQKAQQALSALLSTHEHLMTVDAFCSPSIDASETPMLWLRDLDIPCDLLLRKIMAKLHLQLTELKSIV